ncbi:D-tyrosyl-tRNA deacylase [Metschnikowia bicuspidata var. bicuspidata NRRL YB-4993]|uniref:D-aminoacyl-tRNA deacylase n=1 Tax=Metschnikowia bicuspidata var. bicuspidata NRRL YB-4993 TaxID=869754 RepID=A0A1A0HJY5_9ASCO|nr:D-tyrosyl-tRNA deacylase [Metschnikowia bicuspidata var. bicuspidata NRRL YB-4993]OBA24197.1 D-tyrosyl-tRNA deacylase [Metschnikowia bicuspidata var. bicuspidata NRRL YB-4993]
MRVVIQKVKRASVSVDDILVSLIGRGLMLLVGISTEDTSDDVAKLVKKVASLRLFEDFSDPPPEQAKWYGKPWAKSLAHDRELSVLSVSQFTLYGTIRKGTKPDFHKAAKGGSARPLYEEFLANLRKELGDENRVKDGKFGEMMDVELVNDGPVTIVWDTRENTI